MLKDVIQATGIGSVKVTVIATENIAAFQVATIKGKNADSADTLHMGNIAGVMLGAVASGFAGQAVAEGQIKNSAWTWNTGDVLFLNGEALSKVAPVTGFRVVIGYAVTTDTIYVDISECIRL